MVEEKELDLEIADSAPVKKKTGKLIMLAVIGVLVLSANIFGVLYYLNSDGEDESTDADTKEVTTATQESSASAQQKNPALYLAVQPPLVANFEVHTAASFLQLEMSLMARDQRVINLAREHMPVIRNNILELMSAQKFEVVTTRAGKEQLRQAILETVQKVIDKAVRDANENNKDKDKSDEQPQGNIESVYFTSFIIQ